MISEVIKEILILKTEFLKGHLRKWDHKKLENIEIWTVVEVQEVTKEKTETIEEINN